MWLDDDVEAALAWRQAQNESCSGCGNPKAESFNPDGPAYEATALRCRACEARDHEARNFAKDGDTSGLYIAVKEVHDG